MRSTPVVFAAVVALSSCALLGAQAVPAAPEGWKTESQGGVTLYTPPDLSPGETFSAAIYAPEPLGARSLPDWLGVVTDRASVRPGRPTTPLKIGARKGIVTSGVGVYAAPDGRTLGTLFIGVSTDGRRARLMRIVFSGTGALTRRYQTQIGALSRELGDEARHDTAGPASSSPAASPVPGKLALGGKLVEGVYVGQQLYDGKPNRRFRLYLYADGEYRMCDENDKEAEFFGTGRYRYDPRTGNLEIASEFNLTNEALTPGDAVSVYGHDATGKPFIYGKNNHYVAWVVTTLRYAGPATRPSPEGEATAKVEAKRYKWVTPPGQGVKAGQIAALIHDYNVRISPGGVGGLNTDVTDETYLLLKDGTVHHGLPVPPDQLDVARSRQNEPRTWGRWHRDGGRYLVAWADRPGQFVPLRGAAALSAVAGTRLQGRWGAGSSSASLAGSSYRLWGVTFTPDGRFVKDGRGGSGNSQFLQNGGQPAISSQYDNGGSYTSATGGNFTVGTGRTGTPASHRSGTYSLDGYVMTLRYDDGRVERTPFFFLDASHKELSFEGATLGRDDK